MPVRVAIYSRVSSLQQSSANQITELENLAKRSGWELVGIYDESVSGAKSVSERPALKRLIRDASHRRFDKIIVWSCDRLGRSMQHLVHVLTELNEHGVHIFSYKQGVDTETHMGRMFWQFLGIFAEFENTIRRERQALGIKKAQERGVRFGRPRVSAKQRERIVELRKSGKGYLAIGRSLGAGTGTVMRVCKEAGL